MHLEMYLPENTPMAKLTIHEKIGDKWDTDEWYAPTLEQVAEAAGMNLGKMNAAYKQLAALGVPTITMTSYTASGNDTNDPAKAKRWQAFFRHPENSGMSSCAKGGSARKALEAAVEMETKRQRQNMTSAAEYHEREAKRLRRKLESEGPGSR
jgi:hypothetical protein